MLILAFLLAACGPDDADDADDTGLQDGGSDPEDTGPWAPPYSQGKCPVLQEGDNDAFPTGDTDYDVQIRLPAAPEGAPVLFAWHWLGGSANQIINQMDLAELAADEGVVVVAPDSDRSMYEWHFLDDPQGNPDLLLFEDLLACLSEQYEVDLERVHALGMSAGGLQTTYLTMYEAQWLASTAPFSGGVIEGLYSSPARPLPVLLTWGGPTDTYSGLSFEEASTLFSQELQQDGSFVVECVHDGGHTIPSGATEYAWEFLRDHPMSLRSEPYAAGLPEAFPDWCRLP